MLTNAYAIYDNKALVYGTPFFAPTDGSAVRSFQELANDTRTTVGTHPGDFTMFCVGTYDDQKGILTGMSPVRHVADAAALVQVQARLPLTDAVQLDADITSRVQRNGEAR